MIGKVMFVSARRSPASNAESDDSAVSVRNTLKSFNQAGVAIRGGT
jgi:hypothetical protein